MTTTAPVTSPANRASSSESVNRLELERFFAGVGACMAKAETGTANDSPSVRMSEVEKFFSTIRHGVEPQQRQLDRKQATRFNVFDFIEPDENRLSDVLAWLLDPNETHGQGDLFLRLLFKQLELVPDDKLTMDAMVQREAPTFGIEKYRRRMDVLVKAGAWLVIENKVDSFEQFEQVKDYLEHLRRCAGNRKHTLIYLTPNGRSPESLTPAKLKEQEDNGQLHCWSYQVELRLWLVNCRHECRAQRIRIFLTDFIGHIESDLERSSVDEQENEKHEN